jgi:hypothetical protein
MTTLAFSMASLTALSLPLYYSAYNSLPTLKNSNYSMALHISLLLLSILTFTLCAFLRLGPSWLFSTAALLGFNPLN